MNRHLARKILFDIKTIFDKYKITFYLDCGTLLGAIRDNDFISFDADDVDIGILKPIFLDFVLWKKVVHELTIKNILVVGVWDDASFSCKQYDKNNKFCILDVHVIKKVDKEYHLTMKDCYWYFPEEMFNSLDTTTFYKSQFKVPHNPEQYLARLYGDNWRTPRIDGTIWQSKFIRPIFYHCIQQYPRYIPIIRRK